MFKPFVINPPVFFGSLLIIGLFLAVGIFFPSQAEAIFGQLQAHQLWTALSAGDLMLGPMTRDPISASCHGSPCSLPPGHYGVGEPPTHYTAPPTAVREDISVTFFHLGIHAWDVYTVVGPSLAYFGYRYNLRLTIRASTRCSKSASTAPSDTQSISCDCRHYFGPRHVHGRRRAQINSGLNFVLGVPIAPAGGETETTMLQEEDENGAVALHSAAEGMRDFVYGVAVASHPLAVLAPLATGKPEIRFEARTYFSNGCRGYDVMGMGRDQLIADVLAQFERYLSLVQSPEVQLVQDAPEPPPEAGMKLLSRSQMGQPPRWPIGLIGGFLPISVVNCHWCFPIRAGAVATKRSFSV